jgi:uncharacterized protein YecE (DUF72 family)
MAVYAGTSGWAYPNWKPDFYPAKLASAKFLGYYASRLNSVEVNYTFRRRLTESLAAKWLEQTPPEFRFGFKANQFLTHVRQLRAPDDEVRGFFDALAPMQRADRLGPVLFQLPPSFKPDLPLLQEFAAKLPRTVRCAFEFRHAGWFTDAVFDAMRKHNLGLCVAEAEKLTVPDVVTADFAYYRFRMGTYTDAELNALIERVGARAREVELVYGYFKHEETAEGAHYAEKLLQALGSARSGAAG